MHEYIQSGINGLNMGVGGFSQINPMSQQNAFQDLINSSQKVSVKHAAQSREQMNSNLTKGSKTQMRDSRAGSLNGEATGTQGMIFNNSEAKYITSNPTENSQISMQHTMKIHKNNSAKRQNGPHRGSRDQNRIIAHNTVQ